MNNKTNNNLSIGETLLIPSNEPNTDETIYIVKSGDTLWSIANKYGTTVANLKSLNNLTSNSLSIGQKLLIKSSLKDDTANKYVVKSGDNLYAIGQLYGVSVSDLKEANDLSSNILQIGQVLTIPIQSKTYTVKSGDTLYSIARANNTTVTNLINLNNLSTSVLSIGQKLIIP